LSASAGATPKKFETCVRAACDLGLFLACGISFFFARVAILFPPESLTRAHGRALSAARARVFTAAQVNAVLVWQLQRVGLLQQDSVGRTVLFSVLLPCPVLGLDIGVLLTLFSADPSRLFDYSLRVHLIVGTQFLFVAATLSVTTVWLEMANKAEAGRTAVAPLPAVGSGSSSGVNVHLRRCGSSSGGYGPYRAVLYGAAWGSSLAMLAFLVAIADPLCASVVLLVVMALVGARLSSFRRASAVASWAPSLRRCCATSTASVATASTAATTTRSSAASTCFTTRPRAASTYHARCFSTSSPS
jgi:hypothetical protein